MASPMRETMHTEHRFSKSEHAMWHEDARLWREEIQRAMADLGRFEEIRREHKRTLDAHVEAIRTHEARQLEHEGALAAPESGTPSGELDRLASIHQAEADHHRQQRDAHERTKRHHHNRIARWSLLTRALEEPM